jgi:hypothetical protein
MNPTKDKATIERLHEEDKDSKWFGVVRDVDGKAVLEDYGRFTKLFATTAKTSAPTRRQFPQLVSFIGVTNAGKSTLIKLLISLGYPARQRGGTEYFPSPVVGSLGNENEPTSGEVHLYADSATHNHDRPILYADCEGFEGGEKAPLGSRSRMYGGPTHPLESQAEDSVRTRQIRWATTDERRKREYAVTSLYPRLLYTFSDCVVFVLRNPKTFQSAVLTKLIDWGAAALERSINQPRLPHCVVVVNDSDAALDESEWDSGSATRSLLSSVQGAVNYTEGVPRFRELADHWRKLGRDVCSIEDLILCYYGSFKVIRMPAGKRFRRMEEQVTKLRGLIQECCDRSFEAKRRTRMQTDAAELDGYLQSGFDHFTTHLDLPFDFMQVSLVQNPIPHDFGDHILQLCLAMERAATGTREQTQELFVRIGSLVASCVLLDCARYRKGRLEKLSIQYEGFFERAIGDYLTLHSVCAYKTPDGSRKCAMVEARHNVKGHQDARGIIASGEFIPPLGPGFAYQWRRQLKESMSHLQNNFCHRMERTGLETLDQHVAWDIHLVCVNAFYGRLPGAGTTLQSHATCLCCLMAVPQFVLRCGHVLCEKCIRACGEEGELEVKLKCCPLHPATTEWEKPLTIYFKAPEAGVCILSLDGGGIRGIVQLGLLRSIEQVLGNHVPVQRFFDLIVGTGTGGLIAMSLAAGARSVENCIDMFTVTCDYAYAPDDLLTRVLRQGRSKRTDRLHEALKTTFTGKNRLFGEADQSPHGIKVAVTSTNETERQTVLFANYRRPASDDPDYHFQRSNDPGTEVRTWQAVGASMADVLNLKPMRLHGQSFAHTDIKDVNPVFLAADEACRNWPSAQLSMVLSLGTGQNRGTIGRKSIVRKLEDNMDVSSVAPSRMSWLAHRYRHRRVRSGEVIFAAESRWQEFTSATAREYPHTDGHGSIRLNPDLGSDDEPPSDDDHGSLRPLISRVKDVLEKPLEQKDVKRTAHRLIATSFYLCTRKCIAGEKGGQVVSGHIACRFENDVEMLQGLGKVLRDHSTDGFEPYFEIRPVVESAHISTRITLTNGKISKLIEAGSFERVEVKIRLDSSIRKASSIQLFLGPPDGHVTHGHPIGGLPRVLLDHGSLRATRKGPNGHINPDEVFRRGSQRSLTSPIASLHRYPSTPTLSLYPTGRNTKLSSWSTVTSRSDLDQSSTSSATSFTGDFPGGSRFTKKFDVEDRAENANLIPRCLSPLDPLQHREIESRKRSVLLPPLPSRPRDTLRRESDANRSLAVRSSVSDRLSSTTSLEADRSVSSLFELYL